MPELQDPYLRAVSETLCAQATPHLNDPLLYARRIVAVRLTKEGQLPGLKAKAAAAYAALAQDIAVALSGVSGAEGLRQELTEQSAGVAIEALIQRSVGFLLAAPSARTQALLRRIAEINGTLLDALQRGIDAASQPEPAAKGDALKDVLGQTLQAFLRTRFNETALQVVGIHRVVGGYSKETLIVELGGTAVLPSSIVIRHDKHAMGHSEGGLAQEWRLLQVLHEAGIAVPQPLALETAGTVLPGPFLVTSRVAGRNIGDTFDAYAGNEAVALDLAANLAKLHTLPVARLGSGVVGADVGSQTRMRGLIEQLEAEWRSWNWPSTLLETAYGWLRHNLGVVGPQRALVHGDIGFHNFLVDGDRITALLDWEIASVGNPAQDLGYAYHCVVRLVEWQRFMQAYVAAGATLPSQAEVDFYSIWASVWRATISLRCRLAFEAGHLSGPQFAYPSAYLFQRELQMLAQKLNVIL